MDGQLAPTAVLAILAYTCSRKREITNCDCMKMGLPCINTCKLQIATINPSSFIQDSNVDLEDVSDNEYEVDSVSNSDLKLVNL